MFEATKKRKKSEIYGTIRSYFAGTAPDSTTEQITGKSITYVHIYLK